MPWLSASCAIFSSQSSPTASCWCTVIRCCLLGPPGYGIAPKPQQFISSCRGETTMNNLPSMMEVIHARARVWNGFDTYTYIYIYTYIFIYNYTHLFIYLSIVFFVCLFILVLQWTLVSTPSENTRRCRKPSSDTTKGHTDRTNGPMKQKQQRNSVLPNKPFSHVRALFVQHFNYPIQICLKTVILGYLPYKPTYIRCIQDSSQRRGWNSSDCCTTGTWPIPHRRRHLSSDRE